MSLNWAAASAFSTTGSNTIRQQPRMQKRGSTPSFPLISPVRLPARETGVRVDPLEAEADQIGSKRVTDLQILQDLHDSQINGAIRWFFDDIWHVKLGGGFLGWGAEATV